MSKLRLDQGQVDAARGAAAQIARAVHAEAMTRTTVAVERATLRLFGLDGVDEEDVPLPNRVVNDLLERGLLTYGAALPVAAAMQAHGLTIQQLGEAVVAGTIELAMPADISAARAEALRLAEVACARIRANAADRARMLEAAAPARTPWLYLIVATGNIHEDITQARAAAEQGADVIAVIRSTGQSLLDYVPFGATTEGFGGTYATQENFRLMRAALDEVGEKLGRYIRLTNYCSGLCMPEIAAMGALERLDMMLNDAMYGIIFRDINLQRTFIDQFFSRMINAYAGIIINTGEDNYLTTADAYEAAHTVLASQLINEQFARLSGMPVHLMGLGHAFEINPAMENGFLWELAHAQLVRQVFPDAPLKYMPPTKYMTGNIFRGQVQDALFNIVGSATGQHIQLLGIMTEAIHTPFLQDRFLAVHNAQYIFNTMRDLGDEIEFRAGGQIERRAQEVLAEALAMLQEIAAIGMTAAIGRGMFADISRQPDGGKGLAGVIERADDYYNPFPELMLSGLAQAEQGMVPA